MAWVRRISPSAPLVIGTWNSREVRGLLVNLKFRVSLEVLEERLG